jgi:uncharacterized alpha-E superfamily protein
MLSRVADALFWMSRYVERAEHVARLLDVWFHLELDLAGAGAPPFEMHWTALASILQQQVPARGTNAPPQTTISHWLTLDQDNPGSIMSCLSRARLNARSIRGTINSEIWRELNKLYWKFCDADFIRRSRESPYDLYQTVEAGSALFQGLCDATTTHDEGWHFIQLGKFAERAEKTLRILDVQYHLLRELTNPDDVSLSSLHWAAVLKSCRAYEAYQRQHVGRVEPVRVMEFLLVDPLFPRSVRFCLDAMGQALEGIEKPSGRRELSNADRVVGLMRAELSYRGVDQILASDVHEFIRRLLDQLAQVSRAVQQQYSLR